MDQIKRAYFVLVALTVALFLWLALFSVIGWVSNRHRATEGQQAHKAICVLAADYSQRIKRDKEELKRLDQFIQDHPDGIPGFSRAVLNASKKNQTKNLKREKSTYSKLQIADCP